jgi:hypothetical protein
MVQDSIIFGAARSGLKTISCALDELSGKQFATIRKSRVVGPPCPMRDPLRSHWVSGRLAIATHAIHESNVETSKNERLSLRRCRFSSDIFPPEDHARFTSEDNAVIVRQGATRIGYPRAFALPGRSGRYSRKQISIHYPTL